MLALIESQVQLHPHILDGFQQVTINVQDALEPNTGDVASSLLVDTGDFYFDISTLYQKGKKKSGIILKAAQIMTNSPPQQEWTQC